MAAVGAVASLVGTVGSLAGGGGGGTQYVPTYEAEYKTNQMYLDYLSQNYDDQLKLINSQYEANSMMTDVNYKAYVEQLVADTASQYDQLYNSYLQSLTSSYLEEQTLEMERTNQIYADEATKLAANMEYQNTIDSIQAARKARELQQQINEQQYALGMEQYDVELGSLEKQKEYSDEQYQAEMSKLDLDYDNLTRAEQELLLQRQASRDELTGELSQLNKAEAQNQLSLSNSLKQAERQKQALMLNFLKQTTGTAQELAQWETRLAAQGAEMSPAVAANLAIGSREDQLQRELQMSGIQGDVASAKAQAGINQSYLDQSRNLAQKGYERSQSYADLAQQGLQGQRQGVTMQGEDLSRGKDLQDYQYQNQVGNVYRDRSSFINDYYSNYISGQHLPEMEAQLAERQNQQGYNLNMGQANLNQALNDYYYDVGKSSIGATRQLDEAAFSNYHDQIGSQYELNKQSALAGYWSDLGNQATNRASTVSQLASGTSGQMYNVAASTHGSPKVSQSGGGGFNWAGAGKALGQVASLFGNSGGGTRSSPSYYVDSSYSMPTYSASDAASYTPVTSGYSGYSGWSLFGG